MGFLLSHRKAIIVFACSTVLWLATMGFLYRREIAPAEAAGTLSAPLVQISSDLLFREEWMGVFYRGRQQGYLQTSLYPHQEKGFYGPALENTLWLDLPLPGFRSQIRSHSLCLFSTAGDIRRIDLKLSSAKPSFTMEGRTVGDRLRVAIAFAGRARDFDLPLPRRALPIFSLTPLFALRPLKEGDRFSLPVLDIAKSLSSQRPELSEIRFSVDERTEEGWRISSSYEGIGLDLSLSPSGEVTGVTTPLGWELRQQSHDEVMRYLREGINKVISN
jgi:hypothetical protein